MWEDPIVAEVHRIRQEMLDEFGGDVHALIEDCNRRALSGESGDLKVISHAPKPARGSRDHPADPR